MKTFKELGIIVETPTQSFIGDKIKVDRILNKQISVLDYKVEPSKYKGQCLYMQILVGEDKRVVFTGSQFLITVLQQIPKASFPFTACIVKENEHYEFT